MRKTAGIMLALLLLVPALASAWTLQGTVQGPSGAGQISVNTTPAKVITGGTSYAFVASGADAVVTLTPAGSNTVSKVLVDGVAQALTSPVTIANTGASHTIAVTFAVPTLTVTAAKVGNGTVTIQQTAPMLSGASQSSLTGVKPGATFKATATPAADRKVTFIKYSSAAGNGPATPVAGAVGVAQVFSGIAINSNTKITATFALVPNYSLVLKTPGNAVAGTEITLDASSSTSNNTGLQFAFDVTGCGSFSQTASATSTFTFTPSAGTCSATLTATSAGDAVGASKTATITVASATNTAVNVCTSCHGQNNTDIVDAFNGAGHMNSNRLAPAVRICQTCHSDQPHAGNGSGSCIGCHSVAKNAGAGFVQDNSGVRAITTEFAKWSHHVTGVTLNDAHCAACHLEGKVSGNAIVVDATYHMADDKTHLRDTSSNTDADFAWDPAAPNHSGMDTYCMSCHDANGAVSTGSADIQAYINANGIAAAGKTASAKNPFGDTISNRYDKMQRPGVVDASSQFNTDNNSHHAVKGPRYTGRTRVAGTRQIASPATFAQNSSSTLKGKRSTIYDSKYVNADLTTTSVFNQLYVPLENAGGEVAPRTGDATLGDDSTLHCGDCHTVGQWKAGSSVDRLGNATTVAIGAHGSNNEYLLRNSKGTDERHTQNAYTIASGVVTFTNPNGAFLVCYNCHLYSQYGSVFNATGANTGVNGPHAGEYDQAGRCDGVGNTIPFNGYTTGTATDGTQFESRLAVRMVTIPAGGSVVFANGKTYTNTGTAASTVNTALGGFSSPAAYAGEQEADFGNIFGMQCANCHNSGLGNGYGGIHGSANNTHTTTLTTDPSVTGGAYIDGMGNTTKVQRFLPGLGNAMHVPGTLGGFTGGTTTGTPAYITGGISNDTNWEQKHWQQTASTGFNTTTGAATGTLTSAGAGCYTLSESATAAASTLEGPSVTGEGGPETEGIGIWGGCDDHGAAQGKGDHGFLKRIVRPVTY